MKTRVILISLLLLSLFGHFLWYKTARKNADKLSQSEQNLSEEVRTNSEETRVLKIDRDQYKELYGAEKHRADSIKGRKGKVTEHTKIVYQVDIDTFLQVQYLDPIKYDNDWVADYNSGCITTNIHFVDSAGIVELIARGEIPIDIVGFNQRIKGWFWKLKWGPSGIESKVKVSTPCPGLTIKENVKFEIQ